MADSIHSTATLARVSTSIRPILPISARITATLITTPVNTSAPAMCSLFPTGEAPGSYRRLGVLRHSLPQHRLSVHGHGRHCRIGHPVLWCIALCPADRADQEQPLRGANHSIYGPAGTFNPAAAVPCSFVTSFGEPTALGQGRRNAVYGSSYTDSDLAITKSFGIPHWESAHLKLGAQFFNIFNHPNFGNANSNIDSGAPGQPYGTISSTVNTPTSILGSFLGGDASPRLIQLTGKFSF